MAPRGGGGGGLKPFQGVFSRSVTERGHKVSETALPGNPNDGCKDAGRR